MIIGVLSDTHEDPDGALPHIIAEFKKRKVEKIIHCGDIEAKHLDKNLFGGLPVICALVDDQPAKPEFEKPPQGWDFTRPNDRVRKLAESLSTRVYVGHKMAFGCLAGSFQALAQKIQEIRMQHDGVRWLFSGHTHHGIYQQDHLTSFVNPGAVTDSFDGYEFAIINTDNGEIVFCRIPKTKPVQETFSVGIISDSLNISDMDTTFWSKLAEEFKKRGVKHIIHCGNICTKDVGCKALDEFEVHFNLRLDQKVADPPKNWHFITADNPVVEINGYKFYVQHDLGLDLLDQSEFQMHKLCLGL